MAGIYKITDGQSRVSIIRSNPTIRIADQVYANKDLNPTLLRFNEFWDLMDTIKQHGYLRAAMSVIGRSAVGAWWSLNRHEDYVKSKAPELQRRRLYSFYEYKNKQWDNIRDYQSIVYKLMISTMYLRYFGQAAFAIIRDGDGRPLGLDFLHGLTIPNVDSTGKFKSPAFVQYPTRNPSIHEDFDSPRDVIYLMNPDWEGSPLGGSDIESLSSFALPIDIYLQTAAREYMKNRDTPEVVYSLPADISDEAFEAFVKEMDERRRGPANIGKNPIAIQGEFEVHELAQLPDSLPYQDSPKQAREEELAVSGVSGAKMGLSDSLSSANLREMRREFHETSIVPLFKMVEVGFYEQVHVREFSAPGWTFDFNSPDFLNAVEKATVHMRYHQIGVLNPNEIRGDLNMSPRKDPKGEEYVDEQDAQTDQPDPGNDPGSPPEGRPGEPDDPSQTGEPTNDDQDPPRGDQHDDTTRDSILRSLKHWRNFATNRMKRGRKIREYEDEAIPDHLRHILQDYIDEAKTLEDVQAGFEEAIQFVMKEW